jgi:hypothetical protein
MLLKEGDFAGAGLERAQRRVVAEQRMANQYALP